MAPTPTLSLEELHRLHSLTRDLAALLQKQLRIHLEAMNPLFRPRRFLGDYIEGMGREPVTASERAWTELQNLYKKVAVQPFDLRPELPNPLPSVQTQIALHEWEYAHTVQTGDAWREIKITSPLSWMMTYASPYSLNVIRQQLHDGHSQRDTEAVRAFVVRSCLMAILFQKHPALADLLGALRYRVDVRTSRELGELPLVIISAPLHTFRPADDLVAKAAGFAGGATFSEIVDVESIHQLQDPLREEALRILRNHGGPA
jgi:hypothetical protein